MIFNRIGMAKMVWLRCYFFTINIRVMLTSAVRHWLRIHFRKVFISLLWEIKKAIKTSIAFFSFSIKTFFN